MFEQVVVNVYTAEPLLKLMLAMEGQDPAMVDATTAWKVWQRYLEIPATPGNDASFQVAWVEGPGETRCQVHFTRQVTEPIEGFGPYTLQVVIQYDYVRDRAAADVDVELWRSDFPGSKAFTDAIMEQRAFHLTQLEPPTDILVYANEQEDEGEE